MNKLIRRPVSLLSLACVAALAGCAAPGTPTAGDAPTSAGGTTEMGAPGTIKATPRGPGAGESGGAAGAGAAGTGAGGTGGTGGGGTGGGGTGGGSGTTR
jgi:hypothetical protein